MRQRCVTNVVRFAVLILLGVASGSWLPLACGQVIARQGQGWLEHIDGYPAAERPYQQFELNELLQRQPDQGSSGR